jgi:protein-tyrosine phosphatase
MAIFASVHRRHFVLHWLTRDLALSAAPAPEDWQYIGTQGIRTVVDLRQDRELSGASVPSTFVTRRVPIAEGAAPSLDDFADLTRWIAAQIDGSGAVLVHCREGRGRSALVACGVLVQLGLPIEASFQMLRRAHPEASLSDTQIEALTSFARTHLESGLD